MARDPIRLPPVEDEPALPDPGEPATVELPPRHVIDAGVVKFMQMLRLHWPGREGGVSKSFDVTNERQLRMALGLTYMAMREAEDGNGQGTE
ncbi:MAG TPA: hypothetical protein VGH29_04790 [Candidatus Binataceae bacterium]|jgi:hypothetical protein